MMETQTKNSKQQPLPPIAHWVLVGVALGLAYVAISRAIDTGSLLEYTVALILFFLAIKNLLQAVRGNQKQDEQR